MAVFDTNSDIVYPCFPCQSLAVVVSKRVSAVRGLFRLHGCWSLHLFLGRPKFRLLGGMYSYSAFGMRVSSVLNRRCVRLHI